MALTYFANDYGLLIHPMPWMALDSTPSTSTTVNAAGESLAGIGRVVLSSGPGTSKTCSAAGGGTVAVAIGSLTFASGSTTVRIGLQDVGATGLEDGTYDVYQDVVGGGGGLAAGVNNVAMGSGTKTVTHGDLIAIVTEMTARGGTDSLSVNRYSVTGQALFPYNTADAGSGPAKIASSLPIATIVFDDGTIGWLGGDSWVWNSEASSTFSSSSTPDEYAMIFQVPVPARVLGLSAFLGSMASTDDFELILYSDPLGTPVAERTIAVDADLIASGTGGFVEQPLTSAYDLAAATTYAVALRPTTTNALSFSRVTFGTGNAALRGATVLGTTWYQAARTDQTGAFGSADTTKIPMFGIRVAAFDAGAAASSGGGGAFFG